MCDPASPIIDFYPNCVELDFNGKLAQWEAVVHLPPIDLPRLRKALDGKCLTGCITFN
jgi:5'-3' exoribonuclease 1